MTFHDKLTALRKQRGLTQEQLGEVAGVSRQTVSKWELGSTTPELEKLYLLCDYFQISMDELTGREPAQRPEPAAVPWAWHFEYKSKRTLRGVPLVHINVGRGVHRAKGILAVGTVATGLVSVGVVSLGLASCGAVSVGLLSLGALSLGLLLSVGAISVGTAAVGAIAVGWFALGGLAVGGYAIGGCALAGRIAAGGYAQAPVAIGDQMTGEVLFSIHQSASKAEFTQAVLGRFPRIPRFLVDWFYAFVQ